mgnify:CR=1 FL=1
MNRINRYFIVATACVMMQNFVSAQGGMWMPQEIKAQEKNMKSLGSKLTAEQLYNVEKPSIKDAIVHFDNGCTAEIVSNQGLILTNHHCGYDNIQSHSTVENDLLKKGFWAKNTSEELTNKNLVAAIVVRIDDVTQGALMGVTDQMQETERAKKINENIAAIQKMVKKESWQEVDIRPFYNGTKYYAFVKEVYKDVRLVGAPPSSIGKFGSDTDNWVWPRHTGDFSIFRIYADAQNHPAEYSPMNKPYTPKYSLPISIKGTKEGEFTTVYGFPGRTDEYLPSYALEQIQYTTNPAKIKIRETALQILDKKMRLDDATRIKYASKYASTSNYWKKWKGENLGLEKSKAIATRAVYEQKFTEKIAQKQEYATLLPQLKELYAQNRDYALAYDVYIETIRRNSETFTIAAELDELQMVKDQKPDEYAKVLAESQEFLKSFLKDYDPILDLEVTTALYAQYQSLTPKSLVASGIPADFPFATTNQSMITDGSLAEALNQNSTDWIAKIAQDPLVQLYHQLAQHFQGNIRPQYAKNMMAIAPLQRKYLQAQREVMTEKTFFSDANSTLRITYGQVKGYNPRDAVYYAPYTYLDGVMEKYKPNDYEFDVDAKLLNLYQTKDYGRYATTDGKLPVAFIATNHTTGGNSGSPALDANGNLIGINFDRVWEGTMSDLNYDPAICRNIMVDIRYVLFVIDKFAGADYLLKEMKINP